MKPKLQEELEEHRNIYEMVEAMKDNKAKTIFKSVIDQERLDNEHDLLESLKEKQL